MPIKLYKLDPSPPARSVMMLLDHFGVAFEGIDVNILGGEQFTPDYLKKNPVHSVPMLEDGDYIIHDSHAILMYLADTYAKDDSLYPKNIKERALVNQILFFDSSILFPRLRNVTLPTILEGMTSLDEKRARAIEEAYEFVEALLTRTKYIARDHMTIADISCITDVDSLNCLLALDIKKFPKTHAWMNQMSKLPSYQKYVGGVKTLEKLVVSKWTS